MPVHPIAFLPGGVVGVLHDEGGHASAVLESEVSLAAGLDEVTLGCPVCGAVSTHPLGGSSSPAAIQFLIARTIYYRAAALGIAPYARSWEGVLAIVRSKIGAARWRLALSTGPNDPPTDDPPTDDTITDAPGMQVPAPPLVIVLAGQSNMAPGGTLEQPYQPEDDRITWYGAGNFVVNRHGATTELTNGPGGALVRGLARGGVPQVAVVGCGVGGTGIREWQRGHPAYDNCVAIVRSLGVAVTHLAFYQGEADTWTDDRQPQTLADGITRRAPYSWGDDFAAMVRAFREDFAAPAMRVVFARIAHHEYDPNDRLNWPTVQMHQDNVRIPGVVEIDPEPVVLYDGLHLDDASYDATGQTMATALLAMDDER